MNPETTRHVLIIEDEQTLRQSMVRGLAKLAGITVTGVGTVREAREAITARAPALVITDLDLPDGSGIEIIADLAQSEPRVPAVIVSAFIGKYRHRLPHESNIDVYEKPISLDSLRSVVERYVTHPAPFDDSPFSVADYVQLAGLGRHSVAISVTGLSLRGTIVIKAGQLWSAHDTGGEGMPAFRRLLFAPGTTVQCHAVTSWQACNLAGSTDAILLEAARTFDEDNTNPIPRCDEPALAVPMQASELGSAVHHLATLREGATHEGATAEAPVPAANTRFANGTQARSAAMPAQAALPAAAAPQAAPAAAVAPQAAPAAAVAPLVPPTERTGNHRPIIGVPVQTLAPLAAQQAIASHGAPRLSTPRTITAREAQPLTPPAQPRTITAQGSAAAPASAQRTASAPPTVASTNAIAPPMEGVENEGVSLAEPSRQYQRASTRADSPHALHSHSLATSAPHQQPSGSHNAALHNEADDNFERAFERAVDALLCKDFAGALRAFSEANVHRPNDRRVVANLQRLRDMGIT